MEISLFLSPGRPSRAKKAQRNHGKALISFLLLPDFEGFAVSGRSIHFMNESVSSLNPGGERMMRD